MFTPVSVYKSQSVFSEFPLVIGLSSRASAADGIVQLCSAPSLVLCRCLTSHGRTCWDCGHRPSPTAPTDYYLSETHEISRFSNIEFPCMHRVSDSAGFLNDSLYVAVPDIAFPIKSQGRHPETGDFGAQWLACISPCQLLHVQPHGHPHMTRGHNG